MTMIKKKFVEARSLYDGIEELQEDCGLEDGDEVFEVVARYTIKNETKLKKIAL